MKKCKYDGEVLRAQSVSALLVLMTPSCLCPSLPGARAQLPWLCVGQLLWHLPILPLCLSPGESSIPTVLSESADLSGACEIQCPLPHPSPWRTCRRCLKTSCPRPPSAPPATCTCPKTREAAPAARTPATLTTSCWFLTSALSSPVSLSSPWPPCPRPQPDLGGALSLPHTLREVNQYVPPISEPSAPPHPAGDMPMGAAGRRPSSEFLLCGG